MGISSRTIAPKVFEVPESIEWKELADLTSSGVRDLFSMANGPPVPSGTTITIPLSTNAFQASVTNSYSIFYDLPAEMLETPSQIKPGTLYFMMDFLDSSLDPTDFSVGFGCVNTTTGVAVVARTRSETTDGEYRMNLAIWPSANGFGQPYTPSGLQSIGGKMSFSGGDASGSKGFGGAGYHKEAGVVDSVSAYASANTGSPSDLKMALSFGHWSGTTDTISLPVRVRYAWIDDPEP